MATGVVLSLIQFFSNRSLWLDEAFLALNFIEKSPAQLMQPLDNSQVAPPLFLLIEKAFFEMIPFPDQALRLFPLLSYWAALYFFFQLSDKFLKERSSQLVAISLFTLSSTMLYFSSEVKQYMTDVAVLCVMYTIAIRQYTETKEKYLWLICAGLVALFLSNVGILILFTVGIYLLFSVREKTEYTWLFLTGGIWVLFFGINYYLFIAGHPTRAFMLKYWARENAFMPLNPLSLKFGSFILDQAATIYTMILVHFKVFGRTILFGLTVAGMLSLVRRKPAMPDLWLIFLPIPLHLLLSALKLYPFEARLILYTLPLVVLVIGFGWESMLLNLTEKQSESFQYATFLFPLISLTGLFSHGFPLQRNEIKENIAYYNKHARPSQGLFVGAGSKYVALYYQNTNYLTPKGPVYLSDARLKQKKSGYRKILEEICQLQGQQWLLLNNGYLDPVARITKSLDSLHIPQMDAHFTKNSSLYLLDFGSGCQRR